MKLMIAGVEMEVLFLDHFDFKFELPIYMLQHFPTSFLYLPLMHIYNKYIYTFLFIYLFLFICTFS